MNPTEDETACCPLSPQPHQVCTEWGMCYLCRQDQASGIVAGKGICADCYVAHHCVACSTASVQEDGDTCTMCERDYAEQTSRRDALIDLRNRLASDLEEVNRHLARLDPWPGSTHDGETATDPSPCPADFGPGTEL